MRHGCRRRLDSLDHPSFEQAEDARSLEPADARALHTDADRAEWYLNFAFVRLHATMSWHSKVVHAGGHQVRSGSPRDLKHREKGERCHCQTKTNSKDHCQTKTRSKYHRQTKTIRRTAKAFHNRRRPISHKTRGPSPKDRCRPRRPTEAASRSPAG